METVQTILSVPILRAIWLGTTDAKLPYIYIHVVVNLVIRKLFNISYTAFKIYNNLVSFLPR